MIDRIILAAGFLFFCIVVLYIFSKRVGLLKLQRKLSASRTDATDSIPVSDHTHYASSQYIEYDETRVSVGTPKRKVAWDTSASPDPTFLDKSKQEARLNPVNIDVHLDINGEEEPIPHLTSNTPSSFQHDIHDGDTSPSLYPTVLDKSSKRTRLNPVNNDVQLDIHGDQEPIPYLTSNTPPSLSKHLQHAIHDEL